jgi:hypothetical protein
VLQTAGEPRRASRVKPPSSIRSAASVDARDEAACFGIADVDKVNLADLEQALDHSFDAVAVGALERDDPWPCRDAFECQLECLQVQRESLSVVALAVVFVDVDRAGLRKLGDAGEGVVRKERAPLALSERAEAQATGPKPVAGSVTAEWPQMGSRPVSRT